MTLRDVAVGDLPVFFRQQLDSTSNLMAAFTANDPSDRVVFTAHWTRILGDQSITKKTILFGSEVAGHVESFERFGKPEVSYWLGRDYWGKGIATRALSRFLAALVVRPLYARAAKDNIASIRVLEKSGFTVCGEGKGFSNSRGKEVEEFIFQLGATDGVESP